MAAPAVEYKPNLVGGSSYIIPLIHILSAHGPIYGHFRPRRHRMAASVYRSARTNAFEVWREETCIRCST